MVVVEVLLIPGVVVFADAVARCFFVVILLVLVGGCDGATL